MNIPTKSKILPFLSVAALFLLLKYAGALALSLLLMLLTVSAINSGADRLSLRTGLPKKLSAALLIIILLVAVGLPIVLLVLALARECMELLSSLSENRAELLLLADSLLYDLEGLRNSILPSDDPILGSLSEAVSSAVNKGVAYILTTAGKEIALIVGKAPSLLGNAALLLICGIWLSVDLDGIKEAVGRMLPEKLCQRIFATLKSIQVTSSKYARAHILLFIMTLAETYIALLIMRIPYALALSVAVATVDIMPLVGAGIILLPWAGISALLGNTYTSLGLIVTLALLWITKQLAEPHVLGKGLGVHPFLTFVSTVTGILLFGPTGAITLPLAVALIQRPEK